MIFRKLSIKQLVLLGLSLFVGIALLWGCIDAITDSRYENPKMRKGAISEFRVDMQTK